MSVTIKTLNEGFNKRYIKKDVGRTTKTVKESRQNRMIEAFNPFSKSKRLNEDAYSAYYDYEENSELDKLYDRLEKAASYYGLYPEVNVQNDEGSITFMDENNDYETIYEIDVHDMDEILYELKTVSKLRSWLKSVIPNASQLRKKIQNSKKYVMSRKRYNELKSGKISQQSYPYFIYDELKPWISFEQVVEIVSKYVKKNKNNPEVQKISKMYGKIDPTAGGEFNYLNQWYWDRSAPQVVRDPVNKWLLDRIPQELIEPE